MSFAGGGGGGRYSNNNNARGGGGGGGYRGGGGGGRGRGRGGGGRSGGRNASHNNNNNGPNNSNFGLFNLCRDFTSSGGNCARGASCHFMHVVQLHATVPVANSVTTTNNHRNAHNNNGYNNNSNNAAATKPCLVSSIAIWEPPDSSPFKIFTGSHDGFWRLWNTQQFLTPAPARPEFESNMNGKVNQCVVLGQHFLFCAFEAVCRAVPGIPVGMVHAWNLQHSAQAPLELQIQPLANSNSSAASSSIIPASTSSFSTSTSSSSTATLPYAHNMAVTAIHMSKESASLAATAAPAVPQIASGSRDGSIRLWTYHTADGSFRLVRTLAGHAREVTGLVLLPALNLLWSAGLDNCLRIWNITTGDCQHCIINDTTNNAENGGGMNGNMNTNNNIQQQTPSPMGTGAGHGISCLIPFTTAGGTFIISASLDRTVKVWNAVTGECVASEMHNEGVICMSLAKDNQGNELLLLGTESGSIQCRNLQPYPNLPAFQLLFTLSPYHTGVGHEGAVRCLAAGPSATFYSGGADGKMLVMSFCGDLGLNA